MTNIWNTYVWHHPERWSRIIMFVYAMVFPGTLVTIFADAIPDNARWFGGLLMSIQGLAVSAWLFHHQGNRAWIPIGAVLTGSFAIEYIGATTGVPFGAYSYTTVLTPRILDTVPVAILFAWLMVIAGAWYTGRLVLDSSSRIVRAALTGLFVMIIDIQIEPVATHINNYWEWYDTGPYYGVPTINFAGWWAVGFVLGYICDPFFTVIRAPQSHIIPLSAVMGSYIMFAAMTAIHGYYIATGVAIIMTVLTIVLLRLFRP
jgi:putative membrane protein